MGSDIWIGPTDMDGDLDTEGHRLAANVNETTVDDEGDAPDTEGHRLATNVNETTVADDDLDTEGHRIALNVSETIVSDDEPPAR